MTQTHEQNSGDHIALGRAFTVIGSLLTTSTAYQGALGFMQGHTETGYTGLTAASVLALGTAFVGAVTWKDARAARAVEPASQNTLQPEPNS